MNFPSNISNMVFFPVTCFQQNQSICSMVLEYFPTFARTKSPSYVALQLQTPSETVFGRVFWGLNTFSEGIWSTRVGKEIPYIQYHGLTNLHSPGDAGPSARGSGAAGGTSGPAAVPQHRRGAMAGMAWMAWNRLGAWNHRRTIGKP